MEDRRNYPSFSGIMTFLRSPMIDPKDAKKGEYVVIGAPFDTTTGSRPGSRYAPNAIRQETVHFLYHLTAVDHEVIDVDSKVRMTEKMVGTIKDAGDVRVYPSDVARTTDSIANGVAEITANGATPVTLGGDHYIAYPAVKGFEEGMRRRLGREPKIGYVHIDSHLDAYDNPDTWGKYYHGSPARRVSELPSVSVKNMVWVGINGTTGIEAYNYVVNNGGTIFTVKDINREGVPAIMKKAAEIAGNGTDAIYLTIDIDAVDYAYSVGTGSYIYGGITASQIIDMASEMSKYNVGAIDVVEVSPPLDPTGNTSRLGASTLLGFLKPRLFEFPK